MEELIKRVYARCDEIGDCWEWKGSMQSCGSTPMINWNNRIIGVRRLMAEMQGRKIEGRVVTCKCSNPRCVNPDHILILTRKVFSARIAEALKYHADPMRSKRIADAARTHSKLTMEIAREILNAQGTQKEIGRAYGVSQTTVSMIKRGVTWRDYSNPFAQLIGGLSK